MSYVVLARKHRPQKFEDVVGQNPVSQTLLNALSTGRVAHAYVFSGPRGVGKTTTARILAKCLNCEKGPTVTPCQTCASCVSIAQGSSLNDVMEIDGASNRGIEQIRDLRETAKYAPTSSRYRIFIIDEAHQITKDAFGALLKILEEPPPHVVFMMATTEPQKIPAPILSRCQRFALRPIAADLVLKHLKSICREEKITVEEAALADIVRFVEGSLRDALSLLDQALVFSTKGITVDTLRDLLGLLPNDVVQGFARRLKEGEPAAILTAVHQAVQDGIDLVQLAKDVQSYYHALLLTKAGVVDPLNLEQKKLQSEAAAIDFGTLERNIRLLSRTLEEMRHSETPRAVFEVHALRLGQKTLDPRALLERLERLEKSTPAGPPSPARSAPAPAPAAPRPIMERPTAPARPAPVVKTPPPAELPATEPTPTAHTENASDVLDQWPAFLQHVAQKKQALATALEEGRPRWSNGRLSIVLTKSFHHQMAQRSTNVLIASFQEFFGRPVSFELELEEAPAKPADPAPLAAPPPREMREEKEPPEDAFEEVPANDVGAEMQKALKHFPGVLKREKKS